MWSPANTIRVLCEARAKGRMASLSMACAASSKRMWVKWPLGNPIPLKTLKKNNSNIIQIELRYLITRVK